MWPGNEIDYDAAILDSLHGAIAGVNPQLLTDALLERDLSAPTDPAYHNPSENMNPVMEYESHPVPRQSSPTLGSASVSTERGVPLASIIAEARRTLDALLAPCASEATHRGLVTLLDVLSRYAFSFYEVILRAQRLRTQVQSYGDREILFAPLRDEFPEFLAQLKAECDDLGLRYTHGLATHAESRLAEKGEKYSHVELLSDLDSLIYSFGHELRSELFFRIPSDKEPFFQRDALFGPEVAEAFPSSADDILHAGTCFALDQNDACVFHLMRVLERGLGVIASEVGVDFERPNWATAINGIEAALKKNAIGPGVDVKRRKVMAEAATHLFFAKDAWRNDAMHARDVYDTWKARSVLDHVRDFMRGLANAGLSEPSPGQDT